MKLSFEKSRAGRSGLDRLDTAPGDEVLAELGDLLRTGELFLPQMSELETVRHYTALSRRNMGVDTDFYPLGSCTMKYNPKVNEVIAAMPGFTGLHPLAPAAAAGGWLKVYSDLERYLADITGMDAFTLHPMAGAHGELTGMMIVKAFCGGTGESRTKVLVPDSAHGTNPASAALCGFEVVNVPSAEDGMIHPHTLAEYVGSDTAALMLTNPNTLGIFEQHIRRVADMVHEAGGLLYYDGANLNAIAGRVKPGDMGFDVVHLNLHKTFATPHGGGGPGSGPVGVKGRLAEFLPVPRVEEKDGALTLSEDFPRSIGRLSGFYGNALVALKACAYILNLGPEGLAEMSALAVLNARYLLGLLTSGGWTLPYGAPCMHEFVLSGEDLPEGVHTMDVAKRLIDAGYHPPTVYFPLIVREAIMIEPTETESPEKLEEFAGVMNRILGEARDDPDVLKTAPSTTPVSRLDEALAARELNLACKRNGRT
ncbi:MAG: aminomethyl-transferring glycine dehydrogenase subunit GcvPB [Planctomycetes bacterium]|nr:aminomethyl-transferring glycine dehydrogenase subunit GcvPB [Planctomycetota bacterium]